MRYENELVQVTPDAHSHLLNDILSSLTLIHMSAVARSHRTSLPFFRNCLRERNEILLSDAWESLDRVQVLGDEDRRIGHFG